MITRAPRATEGRCLRTSAVLVPDNIALAKGGRTDNSNALLRSCMPRLPFFVNGREQVCCGWLGRYEHQILIVLFREPFEYTQRHEGVENLSVGEPQRERGTIFSALDDLVLSSILRGAGIYDAIRSTCPQLPLPSANTR